jgi:1-aminocyclopropane-1-carboxylate deaminase/D-cysteine desulfhydrase-like pyridoxal-dependent ACC family enzyme
VLEDGVVGDGYGQPTDGMVEALQLAASRDAIVLDPVYTGKAMAGLIADIRAGRFRPDDVVVFLHTGGAPALFTYPDAFPIHWGE